MRRRLQKFLPIVLIALAVQILAPIAACWAASIAASDPLGSVLGSAVICHDNSAAAPAQSDQGGDRRAHNGACSICCIAQAATAIDTPQQAAVTAPYRLAERVVWRDQAVEQPGARAGSNAQARAPPSLT
jgi:Protein of unknown function (DUF2946)